MICLSKLKLNENKTKTSNFGTKRQFEQKNFDDYILLADNA